MSGSKCSIQLVSLSLCLLKGIGILALCFPWEMSLFRPCQLQISIAPGERGTLPPPLCLDSRKIEPERLCLSHPCLWTPEVRPSLVKGIRKLLLIDLHGADFSGVWVLESGPPTGQHPKDRFATHEDATYNTFWWWYARTAACGVEAVPHLQHGYMCSRYYWGLCSRDRGASNKTFPLPQRLEFWIKTGCQNRDKLQTVFLICWEF